MGIVAWENERLKNLTFWDVPLIKIAVGAFVLMLAKLWTPLLGLDWYWYLIIAVVAAIKPMIAILKKDGIGVAVNVKKVPKKKR